MFAMCSYQVNNVANLTRRQFVVYLSRMIVKEKDGGVVIQQQGVAMFPGM